MVKQGPLHVLIAGGGLSGLCLAQGLIKDGHTCEVFECDADLTRRRGYYLHMNGLPADLFELYAETSRITPDRRESIVLDDQLAVLSSQPHLGPPNEGPRPHTGGHRRTLRPSPRRHSSVTLRAWTCAGAVCRSSSSSPPFTSLPTSPRIPAAHGMSRG